MFFPSLACVFQGLRVSRSFFGLCRENSEIVRGGFISDGVRHFFQVV